MNCCAHIFIGKEFERLAHDIGRVSHKSGDSAVSYLNYYLLDLENSAPALKKLSVSSSAPAPDLEGMDRYIEAKWIDIDTKEKSLADLYRLNIFNDLLGGIRRASHSILYVFIHFPFYKESAFKGLSAVYKAIKDSMMQNKVSFIGYCSDLSEAISNEEKGAEKLSGKAQARAFKRFKDDNNLPEDERLILFQNAFQNGISLDLTDKSLADVLSLFMLQCSRYFDEFFPSTMTDSDLVSYGVSAVSLDKYRFVDCLFCQTMLHAMEVASVMETKVDVNDVFAKVRAILHDKEHVLSTYLGKGRSQDIVGAEEFINKEVETIVGRCENALSENKSMPVRAAILAALLRTKCDLFHQMIFEPDTPDFNNLLVEPVDYFILHDKSHYYWENEETPLVNPIRDLKTLNGQLLNSESQIRELEEALRIYEPELEKSKLSGRVMPFQEKGFFHVEDRRYRLLPKTDEEPLQESYTPHEVRADSLDLRKNFRGIQDQGAQGSCVAFALTSIFEYMMRSNNRSGEYDLSEAFLYYNARKLDPDSSVADDSGSRLKPALDSLYKYGIAVEPLCRYNEDSYDNEPSKAAYDDAQKRLLRKAVNVARNVADIKSALEDGYPVMASFTLCQSFANVRQGFVPMPSEEEISESAGDPENKHSAHAMVIVGFNDRISSFLVRNSWGPGWGDGGYCYIPYSYVENERLLNFACILTKIESLNTEVTPAKDIPVMHLDDTDMAIRYHLALSALDIERKNADDINRKRNAVLQSLERLKQLFSNHNACQTYIERTCEKTAEEQEDLRSKIREEQDLQDQEYKTYRSAVKKLIRKTVFVSLAILLFVRIYNLILRKISASEWFGEVLKFIKDSLLYIRNLIADKPVRSLKIDLYIDWIHYVVIAVILGIFFYKGWKAWRVWRDSKNEHERQIGLHRDLISAKQKEIESFKFNTQVAQKWLIALIKLQTSIQRRYSGMVSRINNLRAWYADLSEAERGLDLQSEVPYTTLLDRRILNAFFEKNIACDSDFNIDFSENADKHKNTEEYLTSYQDEIKNKVFAHLLSHPRLTGFNIAEHIASNAFCDIAKEVVPRGDTSAVSLEDVKRQSEVFMHVNPTNRGMIQPSTYVLAPDSGQSDIKQLQDKIGRGFGTSPLKSTDMYSVVFLQIMGLKFDECVMFQ